MKKYLIPGIAIAIAVVSFAFTAPKSSLVELFVFQYSGDYSVNSVQDEVNDWDFIVKTTEEPEMCSNNDQKACRVAVPVGLVDDPTGTPDLKTTASITATLSSGTAHVTGIATGGIYSNKLEIE